VSAIEIAARQQEKTARLAAGAKSGAGTFERGLGEQLTLQKMLDARDQIQAQSRLHRNGMDHGTVFVDEMHGFSRDMIDALIYSKIGTKTTMLASKELTDYSDAELVMHMIGRGYACMKLPKDGGPPEVLR
jgi:hypothetical protein